MAKALDLTGQKFGRITAISRAPSISGRGMWNCICECGKEKVIATANLTGGKTRSCGCLSKKADLTGKVYGDLTVIGYDGYYKRNPKWRCLCSCGKELSVFENGLKSGRCKNCGDAIHSEIVGKRFGRLTVSSDIIKGHGTTSRKYLCHCDCGKSIWVTVSNIVSGNTRSCGCLRNEVIPQFSKTHGKSNTRIYNIWKSMIARCEKDYHTDYWKYGAVGITVCEEWHDFEKFYQWAILNGYTDVLTIDRIDGTGNYEPSNCRWATYKEQANNIKSNILVEYMGETKTLSEWANFYNIPYKVLHNRYRARKWEFDRAVSQPVRESRKRGQ